MKKLLAVTALFAALVSLVPAQQKVEPPPQSKPEDSSSPIVLDVFRVNMLYTVTDKRGRFITDLVKDDFEVIENKRPQQIIEFISESDLPLRLAILVDTSNSVRERFKFQQES